MADTSDKAGLSLIWLDVVLKQLDQGSSATNAIACATEVIQAYKSEYSTDTSEE